MHGDPPCSTAIAPRRGMHEMSSNSGKVRKNGERIVNGIGGQANLRRACSLASIRDANDLPESRRVGWLGLEPRTNTLKGYCSTIELPTPIRWKTGGWIV